MREAAHVMSTNAVAVTEATATAKAPVSKEAEFRRMFVKAAKDGALTADILSAATVVFGNPADTMSGVIDGAAQVEEGRSLIRLGEEQIKAHSDHLKDWWRIATTSADSGVSSRVFAEWTGSNKLTMLRLIRAAQVHAAAAANKTPMTVAEAQTYANQHTAGEVLALSVAFNVAEEGIDPRGDNVTPMVPALPTVEAYLKALNNLGDKLSALLSGEYATPKASTLEDLQSANEVFVRLAKQHATLITSVKKSGRTPRAAKVA